MLPQRHRQRRSICPHGGQTLSIALENLHTALKKASWKARECRGTSRTCEPRLLHLFVSTVLNCALCGTLFEILQIAPLSKKKELPEVGFQKDKEMYCDVEHAAYCL